MVACDALPYRGPVAGDRQPAGVLLESEAPAPAGARVRGELHASPEHGAASRAARVELIELLRLAYSGELAAAHAYRGHWRSLAAPEDRGRIAEIEREEL